MAGPSRIMFIRHAEHHSEAGITEDGIADGQSLNARGWQRAGALIAFFANLSQGEATPGALYASAIEKDSESRRPQQTIAPLLAILRAKGPVIYCDAFAKHDVEKLTKDLMTRDGVVLVAWEHSVIPEIIAQLGAEGAPADWPADRYDLIWSLDRKGEKWRFGQSEQNLLIGDR